MPVLLAALALPQRAVLLGVRRVLAVIALAEKRHVLQGALGHVGGCVVGVLRVLDLLVSYFQVVLDGGAAGLAPLLLFRACVLPVHG